MPNASNSPDENVQDFVPPTKKHRTKHNDDVPDWLKKRKTPPNSDTAFTTPFIFKPVNPAQNFSTSGESPCPPRRQDSCSTSSFSTNVPSEDLIGKVVEVLGSMVDDIKSNIWATFLSQNKDHSLVPACFLREFNKLVNETSSVPANKPQPIKSVDHLCTILSAPNSTNPLAHEAEIYRHTFEFYCQMTSFLTVVQMFFELVVMDFLCDREEDLRVRRMSIDRFMNIFHEEDNFFQHPRQSINDCELNNNNENLDAFNWYYRGVIRPQHQYYCDLSVHLRSFSINFTTLETVESILSMFYTKHFLNVFAKEHQKDHGQFYTPREVIRFMWDRVLLGDTLVKKVGGSSIQSTVTTTPTITTANTNLMRFPIHHQSTNASPAWGFPPQSPSVLDPCMGIGSFLCEFINRLTLAAQQCPNVWNNPTAISHLLQSLTKNLWASQWMGLEFADKLRAWLWQKCYLVEFFQFEPFKVWRKIQTDSLIFRLRRRSEPLPSNGTSLVRPSNITVESPIIFLRYMNRKATLQETLQAYTNFNPNLNQFDKDMHYQITPPYPQTQLPSPTNSYSFTFLMPTSVVSAYLRSITVNLPSLCDHSSMKPTWLERNPLIWHRGPNTNPVYALVVRTSWAYSKFGRDVCEVWLRPVFYWNGKNGGKEADFWQKMGDELRLEKKESSPAEAYVPFPSYNYGPMKDAVGEHEISMYSLIMVDRDAIEKVRKDVGEDSEFWHYLKEARKHLQTGMTSREVAYCGTSKCG
ncbi:13752_t:CDS:2 [Acaulospora colombiana]|uniref:13752_t:CDS:1 n=1 Tax=Acaulospora colombiana TaxID=27376 RepID=A0ACA9LJN3_9GLOM|nr:13752_t:CDS:2 [Acaulospora colombiana]